MTYKFTPNVAYHDQKAAAKKRGIEWQFTYTVWLEWWGDDFASRGKGRGKLCMARKNDTGPYHPDNVFKCLYEENTRIFDRSPSNHKRSATLRAHFDSSAGDISRQKMRDAWKRRKQNTETI